MIQVVGFHQSCIFKWLLSKWFWDGRNYVTRIFFKKSRTFIKMIIEWCIAVNFNLWCNQSNLLISYDVSGSRLEYDSWIGFSKRNSILKINLLLNNQNPLGKVKIKSKCVSESKENVTFFFRNPLLVEISILIEIKAQEML